MKDDLTRVSLKFEPCDTTNQVKRIKSVVQQPATESLRTQVEGWLEGTDGVVIGTAPSDPSVLVVALRTRPIPLSEEEDADRWRAVTKVLWQHPEVSTTSTGGRGSALLKRMFVGSDGERVQSAFADAFGDDA